MSGYDQYFKKRAKAQKGAPVKSKKKPANKSQFPVKRRRKGFPVMPVVGAAAGLFLGLWALLYVDEIDHFLDKIEIQAVTSSMAQTKDAGKKDASKSGKEAETAESTADTVAAEPVTKESWTPEEIALFNKLDERKRELDIRESELAKLEEELQRQKSMLEGRMQELEKTRRKIAGQLEDRVKVDEKRVTKLVDVYSNMKPVNAAQVIEKLDEDLAVEVLGNMKKKSAADILNLLPPEKSQKLSEKYTGYNRR